MSMTETRLGICLLSACDHEECGAFADPLLEQLSSGKYDRMSVLEIPRTVEEWRMEHKTARKRADRAYRRGYVTDDLGFTGGPEWDEINRSAPVRQGRPMSAGYLNPTQFSRIPDYPCPVHATRVSGCYDPDGGLVAYLVMLRAGDLALVSQILGHADVLKDEIMFPLFQHALARETHTPGLVVYNRHDSGLPTLTRFKEWFGFEERAGRMAPLVFDGRLGEISAEARPYPSHLLREGGTGLCLFAARFYGINDAILMARQSMLIDLVDTSDRVFEMSEIYGPDAVAHHGDAWELADVWRVQRRKWDAVSCDTFTGDPMTRSLNSLELWCSLANDVVTVTHVPGAPFTVPDGWKGWLFPRNDRVNWLVLERA